MAEMLHNNITIGDNGHLYFAGQDTAALAARYGTPLYLMDEADIRRRCRLYQAAFRRHFGPDGRPLYAGKACCFKRLYEIMREEGMGIDVVSSGEIYTALQAGYDLRDAYFHGNNKTDADIAYGMDSRVGYFVVDNAEEIRAIEAEAAIAKAKGEAEAMKITKEALASMPDEYIQSMYLEKWDGKLPQIVTEGSDLMLTPDLG